MPFLEVNPGAECEPPRAARRGNAPEIGRIDTGGGIPEIRMVQGVDDVHPEFEFPRLLESNSLDQIQIQTNVSGPFDNISAQSTHLSGPWIHPNHVTVGVGDRQIAE